MQAFQSEPARIGAGAAFVCLLAPPTFADGPTADEKGLTELQLLGKRVFEDARLPALWYKHGKYDDLPAAYRKTVNVEEVRYDRKPGEPPRLDDANIDALAAFLKALTDKGME